MDVNNTGLKVLRKLEFASYLQHVFVSNSEYKLDRAPLSSARLSLSELVMCTSLSLCISSEKMSPLATMLFCIWKYDCNLGKG